MWLTIILFTSAYWEFYSSRSTSFDNVENIIFHFGGNSMPNLRTQINIHMYISFLGGEREREKEQLQETKHTSPFSYCIAKSAAMKNVC